MADTPDKADSTPEESALDIQNRERSAAFEASFEQEKQKVNDALRAARPSWEIEGAFHRPPPPVDRTNIKRWDDYQDRAVSKYETPDPVVTSTTQEDVPPAPPTNEYSFELQLSSIDQDAFTIDIHVGYGEINDTPPDGMSGADDFIFTIPGADDGVEIWAEVDYDTDTLDITGRTLNFGTSVPDTTFGTLYVPIGFVDISYDGITGAITEVDPHNRQCGDVNISLVFGDLNGAPALYHLREYADPVAVT